MPFLELDVAGSRLKFVEAVASGRLSVSAACAEAGVSRTTGYKWLRRYAAGAGLDSLSRRPLVSPRQTPAEIEEVLLGLKLKYPAWGARKICALAGDPVCARTADRIFAKAGLTSPAPCPPAKVGRFERASPNELWQVDFKGVPRGKPQLFGCIDDSSRFCIALAEMPNQQLETFWEVLWDAFGEYGLPDAVLSDNGASFNNLAMKRPSSFDVMLLRLGIQPLHGRPRHPQTQGKVERFFGTLKRESGAENPEAFRNIYNHVRPHDSLGLKTPSTQYQPSTRKRPSEMPSTQPPTGSLIQKTDDKGTFSFKGNRYRLGRALKHFNIGIIDTNVWFGTANLGDISNYKL